MRTSEDWSELGFDDIRVVREGAVAVVTIDAPPVNAFTLDRYRHLTQVFKSLTELTELNCVVLTAQGQKAFCAGLDLHEFLAAPVEADSERQAIGLATFVEISKCPVPVICAINGPALGAGAVFASLCDIRVMADHSTLGLPEITVGRCGGAAYVSRWVPQGTVRQMFFTGEPISAVEAHRIGFAQHVVPAGDLQNFALDLATRIAANSPLGLRYGKRALDEAEHLPPHDGYAVEQGYSTMLLKTDDSREALRSVVEKRRPMFRGR